MQIKAEYSQDIFFCSTYKIHFCRMGGNCIQNAPKLGRYQLCKYVLADLYCKLISSPSNIASVCIIPQVDAVRGGVYLSLESSSQHKIHFCRMGGNCLQNVLMDAWKDRDCSVQPMMIFLSSTRSKASLEPSSSSLARTRLSLNMHNLPIYVELENSLFSLCYYHWSTGNLLGYVTIGSNPPSP